jgi:inhibitor of KinA
MLPYRVLTAGDTAISIEFGDHVDQQLSLWVLALARRLDEARMAGVAETVATFRSLMVYYDPLVVPTAALVAQIAELMKTIDAENSSVRLWRLPVCYDPDLALDLAEVAGRTGLTYASVIERHAGVIYHVYMLGFLPGFAYLGDVPSELALLRRPVPRSRVPAGAVAIAMSMSCIFPRESPSGWHVIGRTPIPLWYQREGGECGPLLAPGDKIKFVPISVREYENILIDVSAGRHTISPVVRSKDMAA